MRRGKEVAKALCAALHALTNLAFAGAVASLKTVDPPFGLMVAVFAVLGALTALSSDARPAHLTLRLGFVVSLAVFYATVFLRCLVFRGPFI